jgi:hypothetical protein
MSALTYSFETKLWLYSGKGAWHFLTLPIDVADEIKFFNPLAKGFKPIAVTATIGETTWKTSVFPDSKSGSFLLAVKADVRKREHLYVDQLVSVSLQVRSDL